MKENQRNQTTTLCSKAGADETDQVPIGEKHRHLYFWMANSVTNGWNFSQKYTWASTGSGAHVTRGGARNHYETYHAKCTAEPRSAYAQANLFGGWRGECN